MTVLEILEIASNYLNLEKEFAPYFESQSEVEISEETKAKYNKLLLAFNNIISEIALTKYPIIKTKIINATFGENKINLENDLQDLGKVVKIIDKNNTNLVFLQTKNEIVFSAKCGGKVVVKYIAIPKIYKADDSLDEFDMLDKRVVAMGIAGEYLCLSEIYDDSEIFRKEYEKGLKKYARSCSVMPRRKFV